MIGLRCRNVLGAVLLLAGFSPAVAAAQDAPPVEEAADAVEPPARRPPPAAAKRLTLSLSLFESYNRTLISDSSPGFVSDPGFSRGTGSSAGRASFNFTNVSPGVSFGARGTANVRHFSTAANVLRSDYSGGINVGADFNQRFRARAAQSLSYSPYYSFGHTVDGELLDADPLLGGDQDVARLDTYRAKSSGSVTWSASRRTAIDAGYSIDIVDNPGVTIGGLSQGGTAGLRYQTSRYSELQLGYGYRRSQYGAIGTPFEAHDLRTGFAYRRPLSFSRRTVVGFNTGATLVDRGTRAFVLTGNASLSHQLARTWITSVSYLRGVTAYVGVSDPYIVDGVAGSLTGEVSRKVVVGARSGYTRGRVAIGVENGFTLASASGRLQYSPTRFLPLFVEYTYSDVRFERTAGLAAGFPIFVNRHGASAGLSYSMPIGRSRVP